ncbi:MULTISPECIES: hypothetical protein [Legionella]|uniref:Uncharacterized protein n=1 Tax=Legionella drozanskii LLAP-1 TaxID=1212489 RepID=A0A0W0SQV2_9GAMM|nr:MULTISPECIES: hypothetical protein [Legionella]KTC85667.1 hypothetical protein Ldro_1992 [Legionella drozanskii LLAP-1]PJE15353.1 MAG: hypothetical protein CK430_04405 [Legionella sp.]
MSDLKRMMRALAVSIIRYNEAQTEKNQSALSRLKKPHDELISDLEELIKEATQSYDSRTPVLNYLLYLIKKFKPMVDETKPLDDTHYQEIENNLVDFILNMKKLRELSHSDKTNIEYDGKKEAMFGFIRGVLKSYTPCISAQIIEKIIFIPFELEFSTSEAGVRETIKALVEAHKTEVRENYDLQAKDESLEAENKQLKERNGKLFLAVQEKEEELKRLQAKHSALEATHLSSIENENRLRELEGKFAELSVVNEENKNKLSLLQQENAELKEKFDASPVKTTSLTRDLPGQIGESPALPIIPGSYTRLLGPHRNSLFPGTFFHYPVTPILSPSTPIGVTPFSLTPKGSDTP